jgi:hypothetical protein
VAGTGLCTAIKVTMPSPVDFSLPVMIWMLWFDSMHTYLEVIMAAFNEKDAK